MLFLTIIHGGPFPSQLNTSLIKYCFGYENEIKVDDLATLNPIMYRLSLNIRDSSENADLSLINGFNEWAENNNIQVNNFFFLKKKFIFKLINFYKILLA